MARALKKVAAALVVAHIACGGASPTTPSPSSLGALPPDGSYTLAIYVVESGEISLCRSLRSADAPVPPGAATLQVLVSRESEQSIARMLAPSGPNGGDLRMTLVPSIGGLTGTLNGSGTAPDGRLSVEVVNGSLSGTIQQGWRSASGLINSGSVTFHMGGASYGCSGNGWRLTPSQ